MRSRLLLLVVLVTSTAACLAHGADEPNTPRRSLTFVDLIPTRPRSESDNRKCLENMLALCGSCKHELFLASLFPERRVPPACCRAAAEVDDHCGSLTRTFFRAVLPHDLFQRCARQSRAGRAGVTRAPTTTVPSVSGGAARAPPAPEVQTSSPPRAAGASGGTTYAAPAAKMHAGPPKFFGRVPSPAAGSASVHPPAPYPVTVPSGGKHAPPVRSGGQREAGAPHSSVTEPVNEDEPRPKVISAGGTRRVPAGVYGPAKPVPEAQTSPPPRAARASVGTHAPKFASGVRRPVPGSSSVYLPPPYPETVPSGTHTPPSPMVDGSGTDAPVVPGGSPRAAGAPRSSAVPVNEDVPKPKVISTGGSARRASAGVYGAATSPPVAAAAAVTVAPPPKKGAVGNAVGSGTGQTSRAPGGYGPATDYGAWRMGILP